MAFNRDIPILISYLRKYDGRLRAKPEIIAEEQYERLAEQLATAPTGEAHHLIWKDDFDKRTDIYLTADPIKIDDALLDAACRSLTARGKLVEQYGTEAVELGLKQRGLSGRGDSVKEPRISEQDTKKAKAAGSDPVSEINNPFSPKWQPSGGSRASDPVERERQRSAAIAKLLKAFGTKSVATMARRHGKQISGAPLRATRANP